MPRQLAHNLTRFMGSPPEYFYQACKAQPTTCWCPQAGAPATSSSCINYSKKLAGTLENIAQRTALATTPWQRLTEGLDLQELRRAHTHTCGVRHFFPSGASVHRQRASYKSGDAAFQKPDSSFLLMTLLS
eukprot:670838-Amphidinium_carterae.1